MMEYIMRMPVKVLFLLTVFCLSSWGSIAGSHAAQEGTRVVIDDENQAAAEVEQLNNQVHSLYAQGRYAEAIEPAQRALAIREKVRGAEHPDTAASLHTLASLYRNMGASEKAEPLYLRALAIHEKVLGPEHPDTAATLNNLAGLYCSMGAYEKAEPLYLRALAIREKVLGPEHPDTAASLHNLALLYRNMGAYEKAEPLYLRALAIYEKVLGPEHPDTAATLNTLASLYHNMGAYEKAEPLYLRALAIHEKVLGAEHPDTAASLHNLALLYRNMGAYEKAEPLNLRALAIYEKVLGPEHPSTATTLNTLAGLYWYMGASEKAEPLFLRALAIHEKVLGPEHPDTAASLHNLALLYRNMGAYEKAEPLNLRALAIREKVLGPEHPDTAATLNNLAGLYRNMGAYEKAEPLYLRALAIREKVLGPEHPDTAATLNTLASLYHNMGAYEKAEPLYLRALAIREKVLGPEHPDTAASLHNLALLYRNMGAYEKAEPLNLRALAIHEKVLGPEHPATAATLHNLAGLYFSMGAYEKAEPLYLRALAIREKVLGPEHPDTAATLHNLAMLYFSMGAYEKAEPLYLRALAIYEKVLGPEHPDTANTLNNLAGLYEELARTSLAIFYGKLSVNGLQHTRGRLSTMDRELQQSFADSYEYTYKRLADLLIGQGRLPEAQQVLRMLKEEEYFEFIRRDAGSDVRDTNIGYNPGPEEKAEAEYQKSSADLVSLGRELAGLEKKKASQRSEEEKARIRELRARMRKATERFYAVLEQIDAAFAAMDAKHQSKYAGRQLDTDLRGMVSDLGEDVALVHYIVLDDKVQILLTTPEVLKAYETKIPAADLNRLVFEFRAKLQNPQKDPRPEARRLYEVLVSPVAADLDKAGCRTLMVSLDGTLRYIPLSALYDGKQYLVERYALAVFTEASRDRVKDRPAEQWELAGLGVSKAHAPFSALPSVPPELQGIVRENDQDQQGVLPGLVQLDEAFTLESLQNVLAERYPVLHVASHFSFNTGDNLASFLLLGDGARLSLEEVEKGTVRFRDMDLLTLSACETAMGGGTNENGREIEGFGVLAQKRGADAVLATLWPVADQSTSEFMQRFYRLREAEKISKAEALRRAQVAFIRGDERKAATAPGGTARGEVRRLDGKDAVAERFAHPYYWAPFILMGNWL